MPFLVNSFFPELTKEELGFRVGILASAYFAGQLCGSMMWGKLSDSYGVCNCDVLDTACNCQQY
jgi:MFS family permease